MDAVDPLCAVSSTTCLLRRTLGGPAPAASPSKADEALLRSISATLKGSKELIEQSKIVMKEYGDIRMVYPDDGGKVSAAVNCKINQLGRHVAVERKRHRFSMKYPAMLSKALPVVDRSVLHTISDPDEYFAKEAELDKTETEIKRLNGEIQLKRTLNFDPINEPKRRNSSRPRKSYFFSSYAHATSATMIPVSQSENVTESQTSQDDAHASVSEKNEQSVPSRYDKCAISDSLMEEDSFNEKDESDDITDIMGAFQEYEGPDKVDFLRKKIGIGEIPMEKIYRDSVPLGSTARTNLQEARTLEGPLSVSHQARVSELEKHIFRDTAMDKDKDLSKDDGFEGHTQERPLPGSRQALVSELTERIFRDAAMDKHTDVLKDDEFEGSPEIMMREQSLAHDSSDVDLTIDEIFSARGKDREAPSPSVKSSENIIDPELNVPDRATIDNNPCSRHDISNEEDNMPTDYSTTDKSNNEALVSSHPLEDTSTEVLANTPGRNVAPDDIARTSHSSEDNIQHEEVVEEDGVVQDTSVHSLEIPLEDIGLQNQSQAPDGTIKELTADLRNAPSPTKEKTKQAAKQGKTKQQPKRGKKVADKSVHSLEMPLEDIGLQNQSQAPDGTIKELTADLRNAPSPTKEKTKKATKQGKTKQQPKRGKKVADNSVHSLEMPLEDIGLQNQSQTPDGTIKELTADLRNAPSPTKEKTEKAAKQGKSKQQPKRGKKVADESHHSLETPQADFDSENQPHTDDANTEKLIADVRALSPPKEKTQIATQREKNKQQPKRGKKVADESHHSLEIPQSDLDTENQPHTHDVNSEQQTVVMRDVLSPNKPKGQKEAKRRNRAQELNRKKRLADADLEWQSGVRRSTRIRYRPLDQWRGERFIYGRIHETITVIGVKSYSPGKDGKAALKVKSFVPEQYSDIVAKGAKVLA